MPFLSFSFRNFLHRRRRRRITISSPINGKRLSYRFSNSTATTSSTAAATEVTQSSFDFSDSEDEDEQLPKRIMTISPFSRISRSSTANTADSTSTTTSFAAGKKLQKKKRHSRGDIGVGVTSSFWILRRGSKKRSRTLGINEGFDGFDFGFEPTKEEEEEWVEDEEEESEEDDERFLASPPNVLVMGGRLNFDEEDEEEIKARDRRREARATGTKPKWVDEGVVFVGERRVLMTGI